MWRLVPSRCTCTHSVDWWHVRWSFVVLKCVNSWLSLPQGLYIVHKVCTCCSEVSRILYIFTWSVCPAYGRWGVEYKSMYIKQSWTKKSCTKGSETAGSRNIKFTSHSWKNVEGVFSGFLDFKSLSFHQRTGDPCCRLFITLFPAGMAIMCAITFIAFVPSV